MEYKLTDITHMSVRELILSSYQGEKVKINKSFPNQ